MGEIKWIPQGLTIAEYSCSLMDYGSEHWEGVVQAHLRLGRSRDEAEYFVNMLLTNPDTLPAHVTKPNWGEAIMVDAVPDADGYVTVTLPHTTPKDEGGGR